MREKMTLKDSIKCPFLKFICRGVGTALRADCLLPSRDGNGVWLKGRAGPGSTYQKSCQPENRADPAKTQDIGKFCKI